MSNQLFISSRSRRNSSDRDTWICVECRARCCQEWQSFFALNVICVFNLCEKVRRVPTTTRHTHSRALEHRRREMMRRLHLWNHLDLGHSNHKHRNVILKLYERARRALGIACGHIYFVHCLHQPAIAIATHKNQKLKTQKRNFMKKAKTMNNLYSLTVAMTENERRNGRRKRPHEKPFSPQTTSFSAMSTSCVYSWSWSIDSVIVSARTARARIHNVCVVLCAVCEFVVKAIN